MSRKFSDFMKELEAETRREGPKAVAEAEAFKAHYRLAREFLDLRRKRGITQRELAHESGVNQSEISRIEGGNANPTVSTVAALAGALDAEISLHIRKRTKARSTAVVRGHAQAARHARRPKGRAR